VLAVSSFSSRLNKLSCKVAFYHMSPSGPDIRWAGTILVDCMFRDVNEGQV
jgi:hypothetical protein